MSGIKEYTITIRNADENDADEIIRIYYNNYKELLEITDISLMIDYDKRAYGGEYKFISVNNLKKWIRQNKDKILVAEINGRITGFIIYYMIRKDIGYIEEIHVDRKYRGKGIGRKLLTSAEEDLWSNGAVAIFLEANVKFYGFFHRMKYEPISIEEKPYMDRLWYIDMIKKRNEEKTVSTIIENFIKGEYHVSNLKSEKLMNFISKKRLPANFIKLLYILSKIHIEDEETQSYLPLYKHILDSYIGEVSPIYKDIIFIQAERILIEGLHSIGSYKHMLERIIPILEKIDNIILWLKKSGFASLPLISFLYNYVISHMIWINTSILIAKTVVKESYNINCPHLNELLIWWRKEYVMNEFDTEASDMLSTILKYWENREKVIIYKGKVDAFIHSFNFVLLEKFNDVLKKNKLDLDRFTDLLAKYLRDKTNAFISKSKGKFISEDIIPHALKTKYDNVYTLIIDNILVINPIIPNDVVKLTLHIEVFDNGIIVANFYTSLSQVNTSKIFEVAKIFSSSAIEYDVKIGNFTMKAKELKEIKGNFSTLWYIIYVLFNSFYRKMTEDNAGIIMENEPLSYTIIEIHAGNMDPSKLFHDIYISFLIHSPQSAYTTLLSVIKYDLEVKEEENNIIYLREYPKDQIYIAPFMTLMITAEMPQWISNEVKALIEILSLNRAILYREYLLLRSIVLRVYNTNVEYSENSIIEEINLIRDIQRDLIDYMSFLSSPFPTRYDEYNKIIKVATKLMGIDEISRLIDHEYNELLRTLEYLSTIRGVKEARLLRSFIEQEERERRILEYLALIIGMAGLGEIIYNIVSLLSTPSPQLRVISYLSGIFLSLILLILITQRRRKAY